DQVLEALEGAKCLVSKSLTYPKRVSFTVKLISALQTMLDLSTPLHMVVYTYLMTSLTITCIGEFTVPTP
ncbi:hypothetical protein BDR06DRAFT_881341, partial [Suillus hirtellus]